MKTRKITAYGLIAVIFTLLVCAACDTGGGKPEPVDPGTPQPHESTITAFGETIAVKGDASISTADFNTAKGKLGEAMNILDSFANAEVRLLYTNVLNRDGFAMIIETGNAEPDADANKSMTIGVKYLLDNDVNSTIAQAIYQKVILDGAFAD